MTDKLTAEEIERLRRMANVGRQHVIDNGELRALCDMASASLASAGDGEVETRLQCAAEDDSSHVPASIKKLCAEAAAEIASLRERVEKAEGELEVEQETSKAAHEDSVAEILRANAAVRRATELQDELDQALSKVSDLAHKLKAMEDRTFTAEASVAELTRVVEIAALRLGICRDRMEGCGGKHELIDEVAEWEEEARQALTAAQGEGKQHAPEREYDSSDQVARELVASGDPPFADLAPIIEEFDARSQGEEPAPGGCWTCRGTGWFAGMGADGFCDCPAGQKAKELGRPLEPAPDHTAAIREAMGALEPFAKAPYAAGNAFNRAALSDDDFRRARAAHAKLAAIIEGGKDA